MIPEELTAIYKKETWHKHRLSDEEANAYHERLLMQGNILTYVQNGELLGYLEFWRINFEQLGRIICDVPVMTDTEDIVNGDIAYINNMWINPEDRNGEAFIMLGTMFLVKNTDAKYFCAVRRMKHQHPVQVYSRAELIRLYTKGV